VKFRYKLMFFVACTPLWLVLAALLLEVGERARVALYAADAAYLTPYLNAAYHLPPETLPPVDLPELIAGQAASPPMVPLQPLSRKERLEHLERRHETAVHSFHRARQQAVPFAPAERRRLPPVGARRPARAYPQ
jgi:hypothetical protein